MPKHLYYYLKRNADLQGAVLHLFQRVVGSCLRARSPASVSAASLGAVAFFHRFGLTLNSHLHFHCVFIDGVFDAGQQRELLAQVRQQVISIQAQAGITGGHATQDDQADDLLAAQRFFAGDLREFLAAAYGDGDTR